MKTPKFIQDLMASPKYKDKNSTEYAMAEKYLKRLYPGTAQLDATGRIVSPKYDMTLAQFNVAQAEMGAEVQEAKEEAETEYEENTGTPADFDEYIELTETIDVLVLMPDGTIQTKQLDVYTLNLPDYIPVAAHKTQRIYRWHSESGDNTCDECLALEGMIYKSESDIPTIPRHPNCRCRITENEIDSSGKTVSSKPYVQKNTRSRIPTQLQKATFGKPVNTKNGQYLVFNGKTLTLYMDNKPVRSWNAVSGKPGYQSPEYQTVKDKGTIPEGMYVARQEKLQHITPYGLVVGVANKGTWRGSLYSWGASRIRLEASIETNTYDRDGFYIHGGWEPGSNGCIDLTSQMNDFTKWFKTNGQDIIINVKYD